MYGDNLNKIFSGNYDCDLWPYQSTERVRDSGMKIIEYVKDDHIHPIGIGLKRYAVDTEYRITDPKLRILQRSSKTLSVVRHPTSDN